MKIVVVGLRGFPNIQGGIETHCEELYPRLVALGYEVTVVRRCGFVKENPPMEAYRGVRFKDIDSPFITGLEAAVHTFKGIWYAKKAHADWVHVHAIGPSIAIPFAKLLGLKVVMTHHGPDYDREKWGVLAKTVLRMGEFFAALMADHIISISTVINEILRKKYNRTDRVHLIYNGITTFPECDGKNTFLQSLGIHPGKYILAVGRFVEEKRFDRLIEAYVRLKRPDYQLVIAGNADYDSAYCCSLKDFASENQVILPGIVKGANLKELYSQAALFVLPSSHEGLPITLLEAMSCRRKVLASDIPANLAVGLPQDNYFRLNDLEHLVSQMQQLLDREQTSQTYDLSKYDWDHIARQVAEVYEMDR
ncbi:MAG: glycosyltransferase family 4 protein [Parabacteroides sp.]